jgi:hypothetical protein
MAAILSSIPRKVGEDKNGKPKYDGGVCYQQFVNLSNCSVCIPNGAKDLLNKSGDAKAKIAGIQKFITSSLNLTTEECRNNKDQTYNLSYKEKEALSLKMANNKMNSTFFECRKKLKEIYVEKLRLLFAIMERLRDVPFINNATLNIISNDTKSIIDSMYTLCQYYYTYAIIALLNADISSERNSGNKFFT